ncbi:MAG: serine hydrolase domain-containing protein [Planctomycetota bacterium]
MRPSSVVLAAVVIASPVHHGSAQTAAVRETARAFLDKSNVSGAIACRLPGQPLIVEVGGLADRRFDVAIRDDTRFRIGSITKLLASSMALRLINRGELGIELPRIDVDLPSGFERAVSHDPLHGVRIRPAIGEGRAEELPE